MMRLARLVPALVVSAGLACSSEPTSDGWSVRFLDHPEFVEIDGRPVPLYWANTDSVSLCAAPPRSLDSRQWTGTLSLDGRVPVSATGPPVRRLGETTCYRLGLPAAPAIGEHRITLEIVDHYDGSIVYRDSFRFAVAHAPDEYKQLSHEVRASMQRTDTWDPLALDHLLEVAGMAEEYGYPVLSSRALALAAYYSRRSTDPHSRRRIASLLDRRILAGPTRSGPRFSDLLYERASLALSRREYLEAYRLYERVETEYRALAQPRIPSVWMKQAEMMARLGSLREAIAHLRRAIEHCDRESCAPSLYSGVVANYTWYVAENPLSTEADLENALRVLESIGGPGAFAADPLEHANLWTNDAYLRIRIGLDASASLERAREILDDRRLQSNPRGRAIATWVLLGEVENHLVHGRSGDARDLLDRSFDFDGRDPLPVARAFELVSRLEHRRGRLEAAWTSATRALHRYRQAAKDHAFGLPASMTRESEAVYHAVAVAADRGNAADAWSLLAALDAGRLEGRRVGLDRSRREVLPADASLTMRLGEPFVRPAFEAGGRAPVDFRIVSLEDEVLTLRRRAGAVELYRRTPLSRGDLLLAIRSLEAAMEGPEDTDDAWDAAADPIAEAVAPAAGDLGAVTRFALHGPVQRIPLGALPLDHGYLADATLPLLVVEGSTEAKRRTMRGDGLFVVDPEGNLPRGRELAERYRRHFPAATVLSREAATMQEIGRGLNGARWVHIDGHVDYDVLFPERSSFRLMHDALRVTDLGILPQSLEFANLSGCRSAAGPITAGAGRFGIAGWVARHGARFAVGSRTDLFESAAVEFNEAFYRRYRETGDFLEAYADAHRRLRIRHPTARWAPLVVFSGSEAHP